MSVSVQSKHFYSFALLLYSLHREVHSEMCFTLNMYKKCTNSHAIGSSGAQVRFYGACGVYGGCVASVINSGIHDAINKCSSKCFSIFYDCTTLNELLCDGIRVFQTRAYVSMAV